MGQLIESIAPQHAVTLVGIVDRGFPAEEVKKTQPPRRFLELTEEALQGVDVVIDFSSPEGILSRIETAAKQKVPLVIGTTGWETDIQSAKRLISKHKSALIASPNFSIGVQLFLKLIKDAAKLFAPFVDYDVSIFEQHHSQKKDHPSGTAKEMAAVIMGEMDRKKKVVSELPQGAVKATDLTIASTRAGFHPGQHEVFFDGHDDRITITHTARNRNNAAKGALHAAKWLLGKKGWFDMHDLIKELNR